MLAGSGSSKEVGTLDAVWVPLATVLVAIVGGLGSYLVARRKGGGTVKTSEASELWQANSEFRSMLIEEARARSNENLQLRQEHQSCHEQLSIQEARLASAEREIQRLQKKLEATNGRTQ